MLETFFLQLNHLHIRSRGNVDDVDEEMEIREMKKNVLIFFLSKTQKKISYKK